MSCEPLAQRRHANRHHAEPVEQVLAGTCPPRPAREPAIRRRDDADADADRCSPPTRWSSPSCRMRSSFACAASCRSPISSRKIVPPSASSNLPRRSAAAPVNAPFSCPNSSLSNELRRDRRAVDLDERTGRERALAMHVRGEQLLARAGLAEQQHGDVRPRDLRRLLHGLQKRRAPPDHPRRVAHQLAKALVLALQIQSLQRVLGHEQHAIARERLFQEIERAAARRHDGVLDRAVPGDHHDGRRDVALPDRPEQIDAVAVRQAHIEQVQIGPKRATRRLEGRDRVADRDAIALALENQAQRPADVRLIVDDDDVTKAGHERCSGSAGSLAAGKVTLNAAPLSSP